MRDRPDSFMPLFIADYLADTPHLGRDEHGAYLLLLMAYWRNGGPLVADDARLARITKASASEWKKLKPVMLEFFNEQDGVWISKRSDAEIERATRRMEVKSAAGKRGAEKRWQDDGKRMPVPLADHIADTMAKNSTLTSPIVSKKERKNMSADADDFGKFWKEYPKTKNMSRKDALQVWLRLKASGSLPDISEVLRAVQQYRSFINSESKKQGKPYPVKHAQGWLSGQRWEGFLETEVAAIRLPDWGDDSPIWAKFKATLPAAAWQTFFADCKPNGSISSLVAPSSFVRDQVETRYGQELDRIFGGEFQIKYERDLS